MRDMFQRGADSMKQPGKRRGQTIKNQDSCLQIKIARIHTMSLINALRFTQLGILNFDAASSAAHYPEKSANR